MPEIHKILSGSNLHVKITLMIFFCQNLGMIFTNSTDRKEFFERKFDALEEFLIVYLSKKLVKGSKHE